MLGIWSVIMAFKATRLSPGFWSFVAPIALLKAELWFTVNQEMVFKPLGFYMHRTGRIYFNIESVELSKEIILKEFAKDFHWSAEKMTEETALLDKDLHEVSNFKHLIISL